MGSINSIHKKRKMVETNHTAIFREPDRLPISTMEVIDTIYEVLPA